MISFVDLKRQYQLIKDEIKLAIDQVLESTSFVGGPFVQSFEENFSSKTSAKYTVGTSSGTSALHLALMAIGIKKGDEVITVPNTFIATTEAITHAGGEIKFVDVNPQTYTMDYTKLKEAITDNTKAILPVHLYGQPCDIDEILEIAQEHNLKVVFDAAQAHLAKYKGRSIGEFGDAVCYSFYPGKNLGAYGDGGAVTTNNEELAQSIRMLANHGRTKKYEHEKEGYNYRLDALQAAVLDVKLKYLPRWTKQRQELAGMYNNALTNLDITTPHVSDFNEHVYHLYVIQLESRELIKDQLKEKGIMAGIHYPVSLHLQKAYADLGYDKGDFPVAEESSQRILSLPMFAELTSEEVGVIVNTLKELRQSTKKQEVQNV
jgi:dTDP-4-amino-4,6-dideoxygalactose transaminase